MLSSVLFLVIYGTRYETNPEKTYLRVFEAMFAQGNNMTRELVGNTLEVYPVKDYGAIEIGAHRFCHVENGKNECGTFRFVHIWQKKDGEWKISRAISYSH